VSTKSGKEKTFWRVPQRERGRERERERKTKRGHHRKECCASTHPTPPPQAWVSGEGGKGWGGGNKDSLPGREGGGEKNERKQEKKKRKELFGCGGGETGIWLDFGHVVGLKHLSCTRHRYISDFVLLFGLPGD
jgi:hypothetical protein